MSSGTSFLRVSSPNGQYTASMCGSHVALWEDSDRDPIRVFDSESASTISTAIWTPDGKSLIIGFRNGMVQVWDVALAERIVSFRQRRISASVTCIAHSHLGTLAVLDQENRIRILNIETGAVLAEFGSPFAATALLWSPDGQVLYTDLMPIWSLVDMRVFSVLDVVEPSLAA